jgi:hypothetical protein
MNETSDMTVHELVELLMKRGTNVKIMLSVPNGEVYELIPLQRKMIREMRQSDELVIFTWIR